MKKKSLTKMIPGFLVLLGPYGKSFIKSLPPTKKVKNHEFIMEKPKFSNFFASHRFFSLNVYFLPKIFVFPL